MTNQFENLKNYYVLLSCFEFVFVWSVPVQFHGFIFQQWKSTPFINNFVTSFSLVFINLFTKTKLQTNTFWMKTAVNPGSLEDLAKLYTIRGQFAWQIFVSFSLKMFSNNIWSVNFEEIINFIDLSAISCLKWNDLKHKRGVSNTLSKGKKIFRDSLF